MTYLSKLHDAAAVDGGELYEMSALVVQPLNAPTAPLMTYETVDTQPVFAPQFDITFNFIGAATNYAATANAAAAFWELAITGDLADVGAIDDLQIDAHSGLLGFANGTDGAGRVLANAGPRAIRPNELAYTGEMGVDPADVGNPGLRDIIIHEIGHVLFLPFSGERQGLVVANGSNFAWVGAGALAEYRTLAGNNALPSIPLGVPGSNGHWDETVFGNELMTPFFSGGYSPVSRMSLAALRDVGYQVDLGVADPYRLPSQTTYALMDDFSGNFNTTGQITTTVAGRVELAEDNDWYRVTLTAGTSYTFELAGAASGNGTLVDPFLALRALDGQILAFNDNNGASFDSRLVYTASASGSYFLDASSVGNGVGTYVLRSSGGGVNPVGSVSIQATASVNEGNAGQSTVNLTVTRAGGTAAFSVDYFTASGTALSGSDFPAASGTLQFAAGEMSRTIAIAVTGDTTFEQNESFTVNLTNVSGGGALTGDRSTVTIVNDDAAPTDDYANTTATTGAVGPGTGTTGLIERAGDADWFRVSLVSGVAYQFFVTGNTLSDPTLTLYNGTGGQLAYNDDSVGLNPRITFTAQSTGNHFLGVAGFGTNLGSYTVGFTNADDYAANVNTTGAISVGQTRNGVVESAYDRDWFGINLTQGVAYTFTLTGVSMSDPYLYLHDGAGLLLAQNDDSNGSLNSTIAFTPTATGRYFLSAAGYSAGTGSYQLGAASQGGGGGNVPTEGDDVLQGTPNPDIIAALGGHDRVNGLASDDRLDGGSGNDTLDGGAGRDELIGGIGTDTASYASSAGGIIAFLGSNIFNSGDAVGDTYASIENITGSAHDDILGGDNLANRVEGGDGNDWLFGADGDDFIFGEGGNDILSGALGRDTLDGGMGLDVAYFREATAGVTLNLLNQTLNAGEAAGDTYTNTENLWGSNSPDSLSGDGITNQVYGFDGADMLFGMGGDDNMYGGNGGDTLDGGIGADTFLFMNYGEGGDSVTGFLSGSDRVFVSQYWFGIVTPGPAAAISPSLFTSGTNPVAPGASPQFLYNTLTSTLSFDPDGAGGTGPINLITFTPGTILMSTDIWRA